MDIVINLKLLENKLNRLKMDYDKYFAGVIKREPEALLKEVSQLVNLYSRASIQNTYIRFRFNSVAASFNSYRQLWTRMLREKEQKGLKEKKQGDVLNNQEALIEEKLQTIYIELLRARKSCNQSVDKITYKGIRKVLIDRVRRLKKDNGFNSVDFKVEVKDGKASLMIVSKK
ncbi:MAG: MXAN_5187 C-terminal domain-containing protein [Thermodesulfobacteriota bacterium]